MIFGKIRAIAAGTALPGTSYTVKGLGKRHGARALIYRIPNRSAPGTHYEKGITEANFERAYARLVAAGGITRRWFNANLTACAKDGPCNFTAMGQVFVLLGEAVAARGGFTRRGRKAQIGS